MEAHKLDPADGHCHYQIQELCELDRPFSWRGFIGLIHPYVWAVIATLWIGLACLLLYEAS